MLAEILDILAFQKKKRAWRKKNKDNTTYLIKNGSPIGKVFVGKGTYGGINVFNCTDNCLKIGNYCSIAKGVAFIVGVEHKMTNLSTYPFKNKVMHAGQEALSKGDIIIEDDVWIGYGATILSGVHIGQGAVIAAGAIVSKDVPAYAIVGGVPAKILKYRFSKELCKKIERVDFSKFDDSLIKDHIDELYLDIDKEFDLSWLPLKH